MKCIFLIVILVCCGLKLDAQQNGSSESFNGYGLIVDEEFFESIPEMELTRDAISKTLPSNVDNSTTMYMPPIFDQETSWSCLQCAEIGYVLTYELNRYRNVPAGISWFGNGVDNANLYHPFYTYNFLNDGNHKKGTTTGSGFKIVKEIGCPSLVDYYDPILCDLNNQKSSKYWMSGIDKYINAIENEVLYDYITPFKITWNARYSSLDELKHWISDHNSNSEVGGLAIISVYTNDGFYTSNIPNGSPESGKKIVKSWGKSGPHALTIVGYNDDIHCFDLNNDGKYENIDINADGTIDLSECEKGAFKIANSWGVYASSTTNGYVYVPYKLFEPGVIRYCRAYSCHATVPKEKELFIGFTMSHPKRNNVSLGIGVNDDINANAPSDEYYFNTFKNKGGGYPMNGDADNPQPIDLALNIGEYLNIENSKKYFLQINDRECDSNNNAYVQNIQLIDFRWDEKFVINKLERIYTTSDTTLLSIDYDLIPFTSNIANYVCSNDKVMRRAVNVDNGVFAINSGVNVDMYGTEDFDCIFNINTSSSIIIHDNVKITAKQGNCKIIINGDVVIGDNVTFSADMGATLKVVVNNDNNFSIANCNFINANLELNYAKTNKLTSTADASISNCMFAAMDSVDYAIRINGYDTYLISNNNIYGSDHPSQRNFKDGILVFYSGTYSLGNIIYNNIEGCRNSGLTLYSSNANIKLNKISKCGYGVKLLNTSMVNDFMGKCIATNSTETQYIHDNDNGEVYIYKGCMPERFRYNAITNSNDLPLVIYDGRDNLTKATYTVLDIKYNNWGNLSNFEISNQLAYITDNNNVVEFDYTPKWSYGSCVVDDQQQVAMKSSYADSLLEYGNYGQAKTTYQEIISEYPTSENAINSMKKLLIAENMYGNDYESLQNYYNNDTVISNNDNLNLLAGVLSNKCDEKLENYDDAIKWYESIIEDDATPYNDSIFAVIDLGNLYLKMGNNGKRKCNSRLYQFVPISAEVHAKNTDEALRQLRIYENTQYSSHTIPENFWTDVVTSQPEGYVVEDNGNIHIHSAEALAWLSAVSNGMYGNEATNFENVTIILENDIDLSEAKWTPIADNSYFMGVFDGNGYTIYDVVLTDNKKGFFCNLNNANVKNVVFRRAFVYGKWHNGGFLTSAAYSSIIDRCFVECEYLLRDGAVSAPFVNKIKETTVSNCMIYIPSILNEESNYSNTNSYGIGVSEDNSHIYNCAIIIDEAHWEFGNNIGFVFTNKKDCKIENCYINIREFVDCPSVEGGLMSRNGIATTNLGLIKNCYFNRDIYAEELGENLTQYFYDEAVADNDGEIEDAYCYFNQNDYWQLSESVVYNENMTDVLLEALNLGAERLRNDGYLCLNWSSEGMGFDNMDLPVFDNFNEIIGINEYKQDNVSIYPNPASDFLEINISCEEVEYSIFNIMGQEMSKGTSCGTVSVEELESGLYFLQIQENGLCKTAKFEVKR